jgi:glycosyltransferase involved in cell wall biosynthesis
VTVVVTSFNREEFVGASIESVLNSSFEDFRLLVVDDCSTDATAEIARRYERLDSRVEVVVNEVNLGQFTNRNRSIDLVETPLLKFHDSDDLMYPHCLAVMVELLEGAPTAGFALSGGRNWSGGPCPMLLSPKLAYEREFLGSGLFHCGPAGALFRSDLLRELGGFPERGVASDYCFWLKACAHTHVVLVPADLFWYRIHPGQELQSTLAGRDYASANGDGWRALNDPRCPLEGEALQTAKRNFLRVLVKLHLRDIRHGRWRLVRTRWQSTRIRWRDWARFGFSSSRDALAGTPLDDDGNVQLPDWLRLEPSKRPKP